MTKLPASEKDLPLLKVRADLIQEKLLKELGKRFGNSEYPINMLTSQDHVIYKADIERIIQHGEEALLKQILDNKVRIIEERTDGLYQIDPKSEMGLALTTCAITAKQPKMLSWLVKAGYGVSSDAFDSILRGASTQGDASNQAHFWLAALNDILKDQTVLRDSTLHPIDMKLLFSPEAYRSILQNEFWETCVAALVRGKVPLPVETLQALTKKIIRARESAGLTNSGAQQVLSDLVSAMLGRSDLVAYAVMILERATPPFQCDMRPLRKALQDTADKALFRPFYHAVLSQPNWVEWWAELLKANVPLPEDNLQKLAAKIEKTGAKALCQTLYGAIWDREDWADCAATLLKANVPLLKDDHLKQLTAKLSSLQSEQSFPLYTAILSQTDTATYNDTAKGKILKVLLDRSMPLPPDVANKAGALQELARLAVVNNDVDLLKKVMETEWRTNIPQEQQKVDLVDLLLQCKNKAMVHALKAHHTADSSVDTRPWQDIVQAVMEKEATPRERLVKIQGIYCPITAPNLAQCVLLPECNDPKSINHPTLKALGQARDESNGNMDALIRKHVQQLIDRYDKKPGRGLYEPAWRQAFLQGVIDCNPEFFDAPEDQIKQAVDVSLNVYANYHTKRQEDPSGAGQMMIDLFNAFIAFCSELFSGAKRPAPPHNLEDEHPPTKCLLEEVVSITKTPPGQMHGC